MKIGFVGLGIMGKHMAVNLIRAGHDLTVYDHNRSNMELLAEAGAALAENSANLTARMASFLFSVWVIPVLISLILLPP